MCHGFFNKILCLGSPFESDDRLYTQSSTLANSLQNPIRSIQRMFDDISLESP